MRFPDRRRRNVRLGVRRQPAGVSRTRNAKGLLELFHDQRKPERIRGDAGYRLGAAEVFKQLSSTDRRTAARLALEAFWEDKPHLAWGAAHLLYAAQPRSAWKSLSNVATSELSAKTRLSAIYAMGMLAQGQAVPALGLIVQDAGQPNLIRAIAAETLGLCAGGSRRAVSILLSSLRDPSPEVRLFAVNALAICGERSELPALIRLAKDQAVVRPYGSIADEVAYAVAAIRARANKH